jgi:hypothetical protein
MGDMEDGTQGNLSAFGTANRPGIPRSLNDIEYFYDAANFAAFIVAGGSHGETMAPQERPASA